MGLVSEAVPLDEAAMAGALAFSIRDPFSRSNSEKTWSYDRLSSQIVAMWAFAAQ